jgi:hypothetical protein
LNLSTLDSTTVGASFQAEATAILVSVSILSSVKLTRSAVVPTNQSHLNRRQLNMFRSSVTSLNAIANEVEEKELDLMRQKQSSITFSERESTDLPFSTALNQSPIKRLRANALKHRPIGSLLAPFSSPQLILLFMSERELLTFDPTNSIQSLFFSSV